MKGYSTLPRTPELKPHHQMGICIIPKTSLFLGIIPLCTGYSNSILSFTNWAVDHFLFEYPLLMICWWICSLCHLSLKLVERFIYLGSSVSSTDKDINLWLAKAWTAIDGLSVKWQFNLTDKIKRSFFQAAVMSILLYGCTTWTLTKRMEKKLDGKCAIRRHISPISVNLTRLRA